MQEIPQRQLWCTGIYLIERGRGEETRQVLDRIQSARPEPAGRPAARSLEGYRAWAEGNLGEAATHWSGFNLGSLGAIWRGDLYRKLGRLQKAEDWYVAGWRSPVAHERLGQLYEKMGRPEDARAAYERFAEAWEDADPALQPRVEEARRQLEALGMSEATE